MSDDLNLDELRKLAEAATEGPWMVRNDRIDGPMVVTADSQGWMYARIPNDEEGKDAAYIAAANPQTILALLDRLAEAERERDVARARRE